MNNQRTDEFLDLYKQLEQILKQNYSSNSGRYENAITRFENAPENAGIREQITAIREIRNLLQHNPKINQNYIVTPSEDIINILKEIIREIEHPVLAIDFGIKSGQIFKATLNTNLIKVINVMKERGFSHVPVIENRKLYGVVSTNTIFEFATEQNMQILTSETRVRDMKAYLPIQKHKKEYYRFMPKNTTFHQADEAFTKRDSKGRRLAAIFITDNGSEEETILSMLTPWSVVGKQTSN